MNRHRFLLWQWLLLLIPSAGYGTPPEDMTVSTLYTQAISPVNSVHPLWTPVQHYRGNTFLVMPDVKIRPFVSRIDSGGVVTTAPLDPNPDYTAGTDGHLRFTLGIDKNGYLHILGDMHGYYQSYGPYVRRYQNQNMMYWKSNKPLDVMGGFTFCGTLNSITTMPGFEWGGDSRFFNDRNGELYYSGRVRAFNGGGLKGSEPFIAYGIYRYNTANGVWTAMGGVAPEADTMGAKNYQTVLYWEYTGSFEAFQSNPRFDNRNRLHFSIAGGTYGVAGSGLIYAYSDDFGVTWHKANGALIPELPIRGADGQANRGDLVARSTSVPQQSNVYIDKNGKIAVSGEIKRTWDGTAWVPQNGGVGMVGPDGMLTAEGGNVLLRTDVIGGNPIAYNTGFGQVFSTSELGLQYDGAIYGIGLPAGTNFTNATQMSVYRASFAPSPLVSVNGVATASAGAPPAQGAAQAFDGATNTKWYADAASTGWLQYDLGAGNAKAVVRYDLTSGNDTPGRDPVAWQFLGSNDGSAWTTLDNKTGQSFAARTQTNHYPISNTTACRYYRLNITANGGAGQLQLAEVKLVGKWLPLAPTLYPSHPDSGKVWLSWSASACAESYKVKRSTASGGPFTAIASGVTSNSEYVDAKVTNGTTYYYVVSAVNGLGESPNSAPVSVQPAAPAHLAPAVEPAVASNGQAELKWSALRVDAAGYNVKRATSSGGPYTTVAANVPAPAYMNTGLVNDTTYYYVVSSVNAAKVESANSNQVSATPTLWVRVDDNEGDIYGMPITFTTNWRHIFTGNPAHYKQTRSQNSVAGTSATLHFQGTMARYVASRDGYAGLVDIYVDDVFQETVNDKGSGDQITLYTTKELAPGAHTLKIVNKSEAVNYLDSFDFIPVRNP